jgi:hypothetical protein
MLGFAVIVGQGMETVSVGSGCAVCVCLSPSSVDSQLASVEVHVVPPNGTHLVGQSAETREVGIAEGQPQDMVWVSCCMMPGWAQWRVVLQYGKVVLVIVWQDGVGESESARTKIVKSL